MSQRHKPKYTNFRKSLSLTLIALTTVMQTSHVLAETSLSSSAIGRLYSNAELTVQLATKPDVEACHDQICLEQNAQFTQRVLALGDTLQARAYALDETLKNRIPQFHFSVADKTTLGTISDANGQVVVFRGLQNIALSDAALSFLMAREMAHVVTGHHDKNVATKLLISVLASVLFPALAIVSASSAAQQASTATTLATNAASTATSLLGGEAAIKQAKPSQLKESDEWALKILGDEFADTTMIGEELDEVLAQVNEQLQNGWTKDLMKSVAFLQDKTSELNPQPKVLEAEAEAE